MLEKMQDKFTKYEVARILGARALQLAMDAPMLVQIPQEKLEEINFDVLKISEIELESGVLPITIKRPFPEKKDEKVKKISKEEAKKIEEKKQEQEQQQDGEKMSDAEVEKKEVTEEEEIKEEGEIMELAQPEDEIEEEGAGSEEEI